MIERPRGLASEALRALADLERRVVAADGGRLKLEWPTLRSGGPDRSGDALAWDGPASSAGRALLGFAGVYRFGGALPEVTGMVDPAARGRGLGAALLDAALDECRSRGAAAALLVVPRSSVAGARLAVRRGGVLDHSEHALRAERPPEAAVAAAALARRPDASLREATDADVPVVAGLLAAAFGEPVPGDSQRVLGRDGDRALVVEVAGRSVGTLRVRTEPAGAGHAVGIHGFAVAPSAQGSGIGRAALVTVLTDAFAGGAGHVHLEVDAANDRALGLYTAVGFAPQASEDYYRLPLRGGQRPQE